MSATSCGSAFTQAPCGGRIDRGARDEDDGPDPRPLFRAARSLAGRRSPTASDQLLAPARRSPRAAGGGAARTAREDHRRGGVVERRGGNPGRPRRRLDRHARHVAPSRRRRAGRPHHRTTDRRSPRPKDRLEAATLFAQHTAALIDVATALRREQRAAVTDQLTGLLNRRGFEERFQEELRRSARDDAPVSIILCDCDGLKTMNDHPRTRDGRLAPRADRELPANAQAGDGCRRPHRRRRVRPAPARCRHRDRARSGRANPRLDHGGGDRRLSAECVVRSRCLPAAREARRPS